MAKRYTDEAQSDAVRMATTIARQAIAKQSAERGTAIMLSISLQIC